MQGHSATWTYFYSAPSHGIYRINTSLQSYVDNKAGYPSVWTRAWLS